MDLVPCRPAYYAFPVFLLFSQGIGQASKPTGGPQTLQCLVDVARLNPWDNPRQQRFLEVDTRNASVTDRTLTETPYKFRIIREDAVWIIAVTEDPKFLIGHLHYAEHQPKLAQVSINRRSLEISLEVRTNPHVDPAPDGASWRKSPHVATSVYSGKCSVVKRQI